MSPRPEPVGEVLQDDPTREGARATQVGRGWLVAAAFALVLAAGWGRWTGAEEPPEWVLTMDTATGPLVWDAARARPADTAAVDTSGDPAVAFAGLPDLLPRGSTAVGRTADGVLLAEASGDLGLWDPASLLVVRRWPVAGRVTDARGRHAVVVPPCGAECAVVVIDTRSGALTRARVPDGLAPAGPVRLRVPDEDAAGPTLAYVAVRAGGATALVVGPPDGPVVVPGVTPRPGGPVWTRDDGGWAVQTADDRVALGTDPTSRSGTTDAGVTEVTVPAGRLVDARGSGAGR